MSNNKQSFELKGKIAVIGGVYSNLQAFKAFFDDISPAYSHIINSGDLLAYCANPREVLSEFLQQKSHSISGNVEQQIAEDKDDCGCGFSSGSSCDLLSKQWYAFLKSQLSVQHVEWMKKLPQQLRFNYSSKRVAVVHGSPNNVSEFIFRSTSKERKLECFHNLDCDIIISGHSGLPFVQELEGKVWLNSGALGMPANDGTPRVWYASLSNENNEIHIGLHSLAYDFQSAAEAMRANSLPEDYARCLESGIWPNNDILPSVEKQLEGKALSEMTLKLPL